MLSDIWRTLCSGLQKQFGDASSTSRLAFAVAEVESAVSEWIQRGDTTQFYNAMHAHRHQDAWRRLSPVPISQDREQLEDRYIDAMFVAQRVSKARRLLLARGLDADSPYISSMPTSGNGYQLERLRTRAAAPKERRDSLVVACANEEFLEKTIIRFGGGFQHNPESDVDFREANPSV